MTFAAAARIGLCTANSDAVATDVGLTVLLLLLLVLAIARGLSVSSEIVGGVAATIFFAVGTTGGSVEAHMLLLRLGLHNCRVDTRTAKV